jgi:hypothetical protein
LPCSVDRQSGLSAGSGAAEGRGSSTGDTARRAGARREGRSVLALFRTRQPPPEDPGSWEPDSPLRQPGSLGRPQGCQRRLAVASGLADHRG